MEIGLQIPSFTWGEDSGIGPTLGKIAQTADANGFHSLWVMDHFFQIPGVGDHRQPMLEAYTALGYVAALTERIQLGTLPRVFLRARRPLQGGDAVQVGGGPDGGLGLVRDEVLAVGLAQDGDLLHLRDAAALDDVRLDDIHPRLVDEIAELPARILMLAG